MTNSQLLTTRIRRVITRDLKGMRSPIEISTFYHVYIALLIPCRAAKRDLKRRTRGAMRRSTTLYEE